MKRLLLLLSAVSALHVSAMERSFDQTYAVEPGTHFSLSSHKGHIQIRTAQTSEIEVRARVYMLEYNAEKMADADVQDLLNAVEFRVTKDRGHLGIEVDYNRVNSVFDALLTKNRSVPAIDFDILMPDDGSLSVDTHKSSFDVAAPAGRVRFETHKGRGSIHGVRGDLELQTHKGDIEVDIQKMGDLEVETHKGDVRINVVGATDFTINGESHKGTFSFSGYDVPVKTEKRSSTVYYRQGNGSKRVELETHKGRIQIDFQP